MRSLWAMALGLLFWGCSTDVDTSDGSSNPSVTVMTGTFAGQNGHTISGSVKVLRYTRTDQVTLRTQDDFSVPANTNVSVYLTAALNLNSTLTKVEIGSITTSGVNEFAVPDNNIGPYGYVVLFDGVNYGYAALSLVPPPPGGE